MDISPKQAEEIQEIEKQLGSSGPKVISQKEEKNKSALVNLLAALGISVTSAAVILVLLFIPSPKKKVIVPPTITTSTIQVGPSSSIVVQAEYVNPFATDAQYDNPFIASQNPFSSLTQ